MSVARLVVLAVATLSHGTTAHVVRGTGFEAACMH